MGSNKETARLLHTIDELQKRIATLDAALREQEQTAASLQRKCDALHQAEKKYQTLFESFPLGITIADESGQILESNRMAEKLLGLSPAEQQQRTISGHEWTIIRPDGTPMPAEEYASVRALRENRLIENVEAGVLKPSGETSWINVTATPIPLPGYGVAVAYGDITERKRAEDERKRAEDERKRAEDERKRAEDELRRIDERLHLALGAANAGTWEWNLQTNENTWSDELWRVYGLEPNSCQPSYETWLETIHPDDQAITTRAVLEAARTESELNAEWRVVDRDGTVRWLMSRGLPVRNGNGQAVSFIGVVIDITARKLAEERLQIFYQAFKSSPHGILITEANGDMPIVYANPAFATLTGYPEEEILGRNCRFLQSPGPRQEKEVKEIREALAENRQYCQVTLINYRKDGTPFWNQLSLSPVKNPAGDVSHFVGIIEDVTERKEAELKLWESERNYREIFNATNDAILLHDSTTGCIIDVNDATLRMSGYAKEEVLSGDFELFTLNDPPYTQENAKRRFRMAEEIGPQVFIWPGRKKNGDMFWAEVSLRSSLIGGERRALAVVRDITERREAQEAVRKSEELLRTVVENSRDGINLLDLTTGRYTFMSPAQAKMTGFSMDEINNISVEDAYERVHPEDRVISVKQQKLVAAGVETESTVEYRWKIKNGEYRWFSDSRKLVRDIHGYPVAMVGVSRDITEHKLAEEALQLSEIKFSGAFHGNLAGMLIIRLKGGLIIDINDQALTMFGFKREEVIGKLDCQDVWKIPDERNLMVREVREHNRIQNHECHFLRADGEEWLGLVEVQASELQGERIIICSIIDITERKKAEERLQIFYQAFKSSPHGILITEAEDDMPIVYANPAFVSLTGYPEEEILGRNCRFLQSPGPRQEKEVKEIREALAENRQYCQVTLINYRKDGTPFWNQLTLSPVKNPDGDVTHFIGIQEDVTERKQAQDMLQESKAKLDAALESMTDAVFISDTEGRVIDFNEAFVTFHKFKNKQECAKTLSEYPEFLDVYFPNGELAPLDQWAVPRALRGEIGINAEYHLRRKDTGEMWIGSYNFSPIREKNGAIVGSVVVGHDITERKQAEEKLQIFYQAFKSSPHGILITEAEGDMPIVYANPAFVSLTGYPEEEILGRNCRFLQSPGPRQEKEVKEIREALAENRQYCQVTLINYRKDGTPFWNQLSLSPVKNPAGVVTHFIGIQEDVTERKEAERKLRESEERLRLFVEHAPVSIAMFDRDMRYISVSRRWIDDYGLGDRKIIGHSHYEIFPEIPERWKDVHRRSLSGEIIRNDKDSFERQDGSVQWLRWEVRPWQTATKEIGGIVIFTEDTTEYQHLEQALQVSVTKYKTLFDSFPLGITIADESGQILESNRIAEKLLGITPEEQQLRTIGGQEWTIIRPDGTPMPADEYASVRAHKENRLIENVEMGILMPSGKTTWINVTAAPIPLPGYGVAITYGKIAKPRGTSSRSPKASRQTAYNEAGKPKRKHTGKSGSRSEQ